MQVEVDRYNRSVVESNARKTKFMGELQQMFSHSPETAEALDLMYRTATEKITIEQAREQAKNWHHGLKSKSKSLSPNQDDYWPHRLKE